MSVPQPSLVHPPKELRVPDELLEAAAPSELFAVWADELMRDGEPWGEFIQLCRARDEITAVEGSAPLDMELRIAELAQQHGGRWWGYVPDGLSLHYRDGFVDGLTTTRFAPPSSADFDFLERPLFGRLRRVSIEAVRSVAGLPWSSVPSFMKALFARPRPRLTTLELERPLSFDESTGDVRLAHIVDVIVKEAEVRFADWLPLFEVAQNLEHLVIGDGFAAPRELPLERVIVARRLKTLCLGFRPVSETILGAIAKAELPSLEVLALRIGDPLWAKVSVLALEGALHNSSLERVRSLSLVCGHDVSEALRIVASAPFFPNLVELHVGGAHASDSAWKSFARAAQRAHKLQRVFVSREQQSVSAEHALEESLPVVWCEPDGRYGG